LEGAKMTKILFIGIRLSGNFGGPSLLSSTTETLSRSIPEAGFTLLSPTTTSDSKLSETYGIKIVPYLGYFFYPILLVAILNKLGLDTSPLLNSKMREVWKEYKSADIIIGITGIIFADSLGGGFMSRAFEGIHLLIGKLLNKPVIKYTADMGPFKRKWNRLFAKFYLNKIDLILARGEITKKYLVELGITTPIHACPDTAFLLEATPNQKINEVLSREKLKKKPVIGISVSHMADRKERDRDQYSITMAQTAEYLIKNLNAFVVLIPNEIYPHVHDDIYVAKNIYEKINNQEQVLLMTEEYPANELKGIIGECDLLIGARYHSIVAALSMCIPTIAIAWHHKYRQVMGLVGQEKYVSDIETLSFSELQVMIDSLWTNRKKIRTEIASYIPFIKESVLSGGKIVRDLSEREGYEIGTKANP
jgi:polysaccharide pyruvyl transferase WcaK-like protein